MTGQELLDSLQQIPDSELAKPLYVLGNTNPNQWLKIVSLIKLKHQLQISGSQWFITTEPS